MYTNNQSNDDGYTDIIKHKDVTKNTTNLQGVRCITNVYSVLCATLWVEMMCVVRELNAIAF